MAADAVIPHSDARYYALRVCPRSDASRWWSHADALVSTAPYAMRALIAGRARIEVSAAEAVDALAWAERIPGWDDDELRPVYAHPDLHP